MRYRGASLLITGLLFAAAFWAGAQNALAGGGSFVTLPALLISGLDARAANITSTVAMFPGQIVSGMTGRRLIGRPRPLSFASLAAISLVGGAVGALLLLLTPSSFFELLLPWLVLFATGVFAWGSFRRGRVALPDSVARGPLSVFQAGVLQFLVAIYGGYFGGGIGFLMLAVLSLAGMAVRQASAIKNALAGVMNASAVVVFLFAPGISWPRAAVVALGAVGGGYAGAWLVQRANERWLRAGVVVLGTALTVALFARAYL